MKASAGHVWRGGLSCPVPLGPSTPSVLAAAPQVGHSPGSRAPLGNGAPTLCQAQWHHLPSHLSFST